MAAARDNFQQVWSVTGRACFTAMRSRSCREQRCLEGHFGSHYYHQRQVT
jgi:hypothetical protein